MESAIQLKEWTVKDPKELNKLAFELTAKLTALPILGPHGMDLLSRDSVMELVMEWRRKWDALAAAPSVPVAHVVDIDRNCNESIINAALPVGTALYAAAPEAPQQSPKRYETALAGFKECHGNEEENPLERLRFFCSLAMDGQDWLDAEQFFDDVAACMTAPEAPQQEGK